MQEIILSILQRKERKRNKKLNKYLFGLNEEKTMNDIMKWADGRCGDI